MPSPSTSSSAVAAISCQVCSGPSNGICHFGVQCCRACASFFHRSIKERRKYTCRWGQQCRITNDEGLRNSCRACRLKKCLDVGMAEEKKRDRTTTNDGQSSSSPSEPPTSSSGGGQDPGNMPNIFHFADSLRQYNHALRALSIVEGISTELAGEQKARFISHVEYERMIRGSALLAYSMLCQHFPGLRGLAKEDKIKLLKLFHNQFLLIYQANLTMRTIFDGNFTICMLVPGGLMDKERLNEHFFTDIMDEQQRQRMTSIVEWHTDFCRKRFFPLSIDQLEFAAMIGILFWNSVEKAIPFSLPLEEINAQKEAIYGELFGLIADQQNGNGAQTGAAIRFGKILDLVNQLMLHTWEVDEMWTMGKIFLDLPELWDEIKLPS